MTLNKTPAEGIWKELLALFFPIITVLFLGSFVGSIERICLARHSLEALNGGVQAICALQFFQLTCIVFANMTQVFIGEHLGSNEFSKVGNRVWQMIWLSLLSMMIIFPLSTVTAPFFFKGTEHKDISSAYFQVLISGNFLFPLGAALSAFFLAQGKRWIVVWSSIGAYILNLALDLLLIFGIPSLFPPMGAQGAAWSGLIAKLAFCSILFFQFLAKPNRELYKTQLFQVTPSSLWNCIRVCTPRATGKAFAILIWTATTYLMIAKGGHYLSVLSIGTTLTLFCCFLSESLIQSLSVLISRYLGSKEYLKLWKICRYGLFFALAISSLLAIPLLIFPDFVLSFFFSELPSELERQFLRNTLYWIWFWVFFNSVNSPLLSFILAARDTVYYMIVMSLTWLTSWLPIYYCLYHLKWSPDKFWFILIFDQLIVLSLNAYRVYVISKPYRQNLHPNSSHQLQSDL
jgi:MATE family multidrug resistance protein